MGVKRGGLGKGLDALIIDKSPEITTSEKTESVTQNSVNAGPTKTEPKPAKKVDDGFDSVDLSEFN